MDSPPSILLSALFGKFLYSLPEMPMARVTDSGQFSQGRGCCLFGLGPRETPSAEDNSTHCDVTGSTFHDRLRLPMLLRNPYHATPCHPCSRTPDTHVLSHCGQEPRPPRTSHITIPHFALSNFQFSIFIFHFSFFNSSQTPLQHVISITAIAGPGCSSR